MYRHGIIWLRRDLRLQDQLSIQMASRSCKKLSFLFIFDPHILDPLPTEDPRLRVIGACLHSLRRHLSDHALTVVYGKPEEIFPEIIRLNRPEAVFFNEDYEPYAVQRDAQIRKICDELSVTCFQSKDQVIFSPKEILKENGEPYQVFTAYQKRWLDKAAMELFHPEYFDSDGITRVLPLKIPEHFRPPVHLNSLIETPFRDEWSEVPALSSWKEFCQYKLAQYPQTRNIPSVNGTSRLSVALRFGTISIRQIVADLINYPAKIRLPFLNELIWREFFQMILYHHPRVVDTSYRQVYDCIRWVNNEEWFYRWKEGQTGIPLVDAGMRQLNTTGWMHNRVRMVVASFLVKHLHTDWRLGEAYFAQKLLDYELSSNNGNWQWAAGTGVDAAPYFRIFHPVEQAKKFDPQGDYIRRWIPELKNVPLRLLHSRIHLKKLFNLKESLHSDYPPPIIDLDQEREVTLRLYRSAEKTN